MSFKPYRAKRPCRRCKETTRSKVTVQTMEVVTECLDCGASRTYRRFYWPSPIVYRGELDYL